MANNVTKKIGIIGVPNDVRDIGAEAQNIEVSYDANNDVIVDIHEAGVVVDHVKPLTEALLNVNGIQYREVPEASTENKDKIIEYIGETSQNYINGYFYKCIENGELELPYNFYNGSAVVYNNEIHILGGSEYSSRTKHYKWNPVDGWSQQLVSELPYNFYNGSAVVYNDEIHILGGSSNYTKHYKWNPTDGWSNEPVSTLPYNFYNGSAVVYNNEIHILGSSYNSDESKHYKWNPTNGWSSQSVSTLPYDFYRGSAVVYNNEIHILGSDSYNNFTEHRKWNPTDGWSQQISELPYDFSRGSAIVYNNEIHILSGDPYNDYKEHYKWNSINGWSQQISILPYDFFESSAVVYNNEIHILGSSIDNNFKKHYKWNETLWSNKIYLWRNIDVQHSENSEDTVLLKDTVGWIGKNLIPYPYRDGASKINNGITFTVNEDGSITVNGTATNIATFNILMNLSQFTNMGEMILSGCAENGGSNKYEISIENSDGYSFYTDNTRSIRTKDFGNGLAINFNNIVSYNDTPIDLNLSVLKIIIRSGQVLSNLIFKPMLRKAGISDNTYEPYHKTVKDSMLLREEQNVLGAKNLLNINAESSQTINGITAIINTDKSITVNGTATEETRIFLNSNFMIPRGTSIVINGNPQGSNLTIQCIERINSSTIVKNTQIIPGTDSAQITINDTTNYIQYLYYIANGAVINNVTLYPMIRLASDPDNTYVPYAMTNKEITDKIDSISEHLITNTLTVGSRSDSSTIGTCSSAEGIGNIASGNASHAEGENTRASGYDSHAEGKNTVANAAYTHAEGQGTTAGYVNQHIQGKYNDNKSTSAFEIGNGVDNSDRSNALELTWTGDLTVAGDIIDGSGNILSTILGVKVSSTVSGTSLSFTDNSITNNSIIDGPYIADILVGFNAVSQNGTTIIYTLSNNSADGKNAYIYVR